LIRLPFFRSGAVADLYRSIDKNLSRYRQGDFESIVHDPSQFIESKCEIDEERLLSVHCTREDDNEVQCSIALHEGLVGLTPYLARDERLWVKLTHVELLDYSRTRWPIPVDDEKAMAHIRKHFFARGTRGLERDNAVSRLWWMTELCKKVEGLTISESLAALLHQSDVRANIIERPSTAQNSQLLSALLLQLHKSLKDDQALFERDRFRSLMKWLNLQGGVRLLDVMDSAALEELLESGAAT
jgi:hypothetical protein